MRVIGLNEFKEVVSEGLIRAGMPKGGFIPIPNIGYTTFFDETLLIKIPLVEEVDDLAVQLPSVWSEASKNSIGFSKEVYVYDIAEEYDETNYNKYIDNEQLKNVLQEFLPKINANYRIDDILNFFVILKRHIKGSFSYSLGLTRDKVRKTSSEENFLIFVSALLSSLKNSKHTKEITKIMNQISYMDFSSKILLSSSELYTVSTKTGSYIPSLMGKAVTTDKDILDKSYHVLRLITDITGYGGAITDILFEFILKAICYLADIKFLRHNKNNCSDSSSANIISNLVGEKLTKYLMEIEKEFPVQVDILTEQKGKNASLRVPESHHNRVIYMSKNIALNHGFYVNPGINPNKSQVKVMLPRHELKGIYYVIEFDGFQIIPVETSGGGINVKYSLVSSPYTGKAPSGFVIDYGDEVIELSSTKPVNNYTYTKEYAPLI